MDSLPVIETKRLRLRMPAVKDISRIIEFANHPKVAKTTLNIPHPYHEKDAVSWVNMANKGFEDKNHFVFSICGLTSDLFMGGIGLRLNTKFNHAELGFWIGEPFWNKGYVTEATKQVLQFGFEEIGLQKIFAVHIINNPASGKVLAKNGMIKEGELVDHVRKDGQYLTLVQYRITYKEFDKE